MQLQRFAILVSCLLGLAVVAFIGTQWSASPAHAQAPAPGRGADVGRFQLVVTPPALAERSSVDPTVYVIDTTTGQVWSQGWVHEVRDRPARSHWSSLGSPALPQSPAAAP